MVKGTNIEEELGEVVDFSAVYRSRNPFNTSKNVKIDEYINKAVIIKDYKVVEGERFNMVYILAIDPETGEEITLRTSSKVIQDELQQLEPILKQGKVIKATIRKNKKYLTFA